MLVQVLRLSHGEAARRVRAAEDVCVRAIAWVDHRGFDPADPDAADELLGWVHHDVRAEAAA